MNGRQKLVLWRMKQGLTLRDAGRILGVTAGALSRIECGGEPSVRLANTMEQKTKGPWQVKTKDWGDLETRR